MTQQIVNGLLQLAGHTLPYNRVSHRICRTILTQWPELLPHDEIVTISGDRKFRVFRRSLLVEPGTKNYEVYAFGTDYQIYYFGCSDPLQSRVLSRLVKPGDMCFDIGANLGWYTILLSYLTGHEGQVHAFEPDPRASVCLAENASLNTHLQNIKLNYSALGEHSGEGILHGGWESHASSLYPGGGRDAGQFEVHLESIDQYVAENRIKHIDFMKLDVEGGELDVLRGGIDCITKNPPIMQVEINRPAMEAAGYDPLDFLQFLQERWGYKFFKIQFPGRLLPTSSLADAETRLLDIICIPPSKIK